MFLKRLKPSKPATAALLLLCAAFYAPASVSAQTVAQNAATKAKRTAANRAAAPNATPIDVAINKAEHIVMLSQRAAKLYAQSALGISTGRAGAHLTETIAGYEADKTWLRSNAPTPSIVPLIDAQQKDWLALKAYLAKPPVKDSIDEVGALSDSLYQKAVATANAIEALTVNPLDEIVGQSAKQSVLIQRLGKWFFFDRAGFAGAKAKFDAARKDFLAGHKALAESKEATADIKRELELIMNAANMLFTNFVDEQVGGAQNAALVGKSTEVMMQMQDVVTSMFEKL